MARYIDANYFIDRVKSWHEHLSCANEFENACKTVVNFIIAKAEQCSTEDVEPIMHGKWKHKMVIKRDDLYLVFCHCSVCSAGNSFFSWCCPSEDDYPLRCNTCGAIMDGE